MSDIEKYRDPQSLPALLARIDRLKVEVNARKHQMHEQSVYIATLEACVAELEEEGLHHTDMFIAEVAVKDRYRDALEEIREHYEYCKCNLHKCPYCIATEALKEGEG